jgi:hypothetical protein
MVNLLQDLVRHKAYANACLLRAIQQLETAARDQELLTLLHHIILANRFWFLLSVGSPFLHENESRVPESLAAVAAQYRETHCAELEWISELRELDLDRMRETSFIPGLFSVAQVLIQICLHSHGHRAFECWAARPRQWISFCGWRSARLPTGRRRGSICHVPSYSSRGVRRGWEARLHAARRPGIVCGFALYRPGIIRYGRSLSYPSLPQQSVSDFTISALVRHLTWV